MLKIGLYCKNLSYDEVKLFFFALYNFVRNEISEIYKNICSFIFIFFFKKKITLLRLFTLFIGWSFLLIPIVLMIALIYRIFIVSMLKFIIFLIDYVKLYKKYAEYK
jgi:hypothetical protein